MQLPAVKTRHLWQAVRLLAACALAWAATWICGLAEAYWALITAVVVTQSDLPTTFTVGRDRLLGTVIGTCVSLVIIEAVDHGAPLTPLFWAGLLPLTLLTAIWPNMRIACITLIIVLLVPATGAGFGRPIDRVLEIVIGIIASIAATSAIRYKKA